MTIRQKLTGRRLPYLLLLPLIAALLLAYGGWAQSRTVTGSTSQHQLTSVTVGMGYIPNVQFAPFYVALARGYYRQAGLDVHLRYGIEPDLLSLLAIGKVDFANTGGDEVLTAGAQGIGLKYILTQYTHFPVALFSLSKSNIRKPSDLRHRSIGVPGKYGASYVGLLALLQKAGLSTSSVNLLSIGYTQVASVATGKVDAAVGYATNEPVQLRSQGYKVREFDVYHWADIAGAGISTSTAELKSHPAVVRAFVQATLRGMADTLKNPNAAFTITENTLPAIRAQAKSQRAVFNRTLDFWRPEAGHPLGWIDPRIWSTTAQLLYQFKQIPHQVNASSFYTNQFATGSK